MDSLSAFMVLVISLLVVVCSLYSLTYMREYEGKGAAAMGFFYESFHRIDGCPAGDGQRFWFIVLFEMMSLSSWFLVIYPGRIKRPHIQRWHASTLSPTPDRC